MKVEFKESPYIILDVSIAKKLGVEKAIILRKIIGWLQHNIKFNQNFKNGRHWVYNSISEWQKDIQVMNRTRIFDHLKSLQKEGWLVTANFNQHSWDKTVWYSVDWEKFANEFSNICSVSEDLIRNQNDSFGISMDHSESEQAVRNVNDNTNKHNSINKTQLAEPITLNARARASDASLSGDIDLPILNKLSLIEPEPLKFQLSVPKTTKDTTKVKRFTYDDSDAVLAELWLEFAKANMKWRTPHASWTVENFAEAIGRIRRATDLNESGIKAVFEFIRYDEFWAPNALSPNGLLTKSANGNRKIDNILLKMQPKSHLKQQKTKNMIDDLQAELDANGGQFKKPWEM